jgi:hypothetical protein
MPTYKQAPIDGPAECLATPIDHPAESLVAPDEATEIRALLALTDAIVTADNDYVGDYKEYVLAPFASPVESRFSDGTFGILYAGFSFDTAREEVLHWMTKRFSDAAMPSGSIGKKQHLRMRLCAEVADVRKASGGVPSIYDPNDYTVSQECGRQVRSVAAFQGVWYDSVRFNGGEFAGIFVPRVISNVKLADRLEFTWDGTRFVDMKSVTIL